MKTPLVIFSYNRPLKLKELLKCLEKQTAVLDQIPVILFQDGPKNVEDKALVEECVLVFRSANNLKQKILIQRSRNYGLRKNVNDGLSSIFDYYERAIVLEDDVVISNIFVDDMLDMLNKYQNDYKINSVTGLSIAGHKRNSDLATSAFSSLGWATWRSRWSRKCDNNLSILLYILKHRKRFDLGNRYPHSTNFIYNLFGITNSWAIYLHATVVMHKEIVIYSQYQTVSHEGTDPLATHYSISHSSHIQNNLIDLNKYPILARDYQVDHAFEDKVLNYNLKCAPLIKSILSALRILCTNSFASNA